MYRKTVFIVDDDKSLRDSLARLDYFASIDIEPQPTQSVDGRVPVTVTLTAAALRALLLACQGHLGDDAVMAALGDANAEVPMTAP